MSKTYSKSGKNVLIQTCNELCTGSSLKDCTCEINGTDIVYMVKLIGTFNAFNKIDVVINLPIDEELSIVHSGEVIRHKDKIEYIKRHFGEYISKFNLDSDYFRGIQTLKNKISSGNINILVNIKEDSQGCYAAYTNGNTRVSLVAPNNTFVQVTSYYMDETGGTDIQSIIKEDSMHSGNNMARDILDIVTSYIKCDSGDSIDSLYDTSLYEINRHHINSGNTEENMLSAIDKFEYRFQADGVNSLISILLKYGIAYLADSVGLGKTVTALRLLAKTGYKAIVVTPSDVVLNQWKDYLCEPTCSLIEGQNIHFCINSYQDLEKSIKLNRNYDIVIFDEAQNFRNMNTLRYQKAQEMCAGKLVLLLGATPVNNGIADIEAQLMLGLNPNQSYDFGVGLIGEYFASLRKIVNTSKKNTLGYRKAQEDVGKQVKSTIISKLMIRRTRADIEKYYLDDIDSGNLNFPNVKEPILVKYKYSGTKLANTLDILSGYNYKYKFTYAMFNKSRYVDKPVDNVESSNQCNDLSESVREVNLTGLTKVRLIKLLDSSPEAFVASLFQMLNSVNTEISSITGEADDNFEPTQFQLFDDSIESENNIKGVEVLSQRYLEDLRNDQTVILQLISYWMNGTDIVESDIKVGELQKIIDKHAEEKIVIFTEYIATAEGLFNYLNLRGYKVLKIDGNDKTSKIQILKDNFSLSGYMRNDYDILVSTNVLSEGVNMNRASVAINYDITWNPMVITQRVGRLNRLDSVAREISVYNFFPCDEADTAILSESNIISKYALAAYSVGTDENYLDSSVAENAESMMEYKHGIVEAISKSIMEEQLDFRTVEFRYAVEAMNRLKSKVVDTDSIIINSVAKHSDDSGKLIGLFNQRGKIITVSFDNTGLHFIDFNVYLDYCKMYLGDSPVSSNHKVFNAIKLMCDSIEKIYGSTEKLSKESIDLFTSLSKLKDNIEKLVDKQEIDEMQAAKLSRAIEDIKYNIKTGYMTPFLCKMYHKEFIEKLKKRPMGTTGQFSLLTESIIAKRFCSRNVEYSPKSSLKLRVVLCIA